MKKFLTYTLLGVLLAGCAGGGREPLETVVDKALAGAERQTLLMAEKYSAREGRLPRTWENGEDVSSDSRWWCSGFFPGVLWYVYENGRNPRVLKYARMFTARVEREKHTTDNHDVGFMLYCSFGNGLRLTGDKSYEEVLLTGARSLRRNLVSRNAALGICTAAVGYLVFAALHSSVGYYLSAFIIGLGNGHMFPAFQTMFINLAPHNRRGTANSSVLSSWDAGVGLGVLMGGVLSEHLGYHWAFWVAFGVNVAGLVLYFVRTRAHFEAEKLR